MIKIYSNVYLWLFLVCLMVPSLLWLSNKFISVRVNTNLTSTTSAEKVVNLKSIEAVDFEMDMEKMEVVLIKRSILDSIEVTIVESVNGKTQTIVCSREIHDRLVEKFRRILLKRNNGF